MHAETSGGSTDTEVNELTAIPTGTRSTSAQTAATPEGKHPNASRSCSPVLMFCRRIMSA